MKIDDVIGATIKLRDKIDGLKKAHKEQLAPLNDQMMKLENYLQHQLQGQGVSSFAAKGVGTAFLQNCTSATVEDWAAILGWIRANEAWDLLEHRVSKTVVQDYIESTGSAPPGVKVSTEIEVRVRRG